MANNTKTNGGKTRTMTEDEIFVRSVYPRIYRTKVFWSGKKGYEIWATRTGHHASIVTFCVSGDTEEEMWRNGKERILTETLKAFES